jgi:tetratricopeptide (TPR) repeat protein
MIQRSKMLVLLSGIAGGVLVGWAFCSWTTNSSAADEPRVKTGPQELTSEQRQRLMAERDKRKKEAEEFESRGNIAEAIDAAEKMIALEQQVYGDIESSASWWEWIAVRYQRREDFASAKIARTEVLRIRTKLLGPDHWQVLDARLALTQVEHIAQLDGPKITEVVNAQKLDDQADRLFQEKKYQEAAALREQTLETRRQLLGPDDLLCASDLNRLGVLYYSRGDRQRAEKRYAEALEIYLKRVGERHPATARVLNNLGFLYQQNEDFKQAVAHYRRAADSRNVALGPQHSDYQDSMQALARVIGKIADEQQVQGDFASAQPNRKEALAILEKVRGANHWETASARVALRQLERISTLDAAQRAKLEEAAHLDLQADALFREGKYQEGAALREGIVALRKEHFWADDPSLADELNYLGVLYARMGDQERAEETYSEALAIFQKLFGETHLRTAQARNNLGYVYWLKRDYEKAIAQYRGAMTVRETIVGSRHADYLDSAKSLAASLEQWSLVLQNREDPPPVQTTFWERTAQAAGLRPSGPTNLGSARAAQSDALALYAKAYGQQHWQTAEARLRLAKLDGILKLTPEELQQLPLIQKLESEALNLSLQKDYRQSAQRYEQALVIQRQLFGEQDRDYARLLNLMAVAYARMSQLARAEFLAREARQTYVSLLGDMHADIAMTDANLGYVYQELGNLVRAEAHRRNAVLIYESLFGRKDSRFRDALTQLTELLKLRANQLVENDDPASARKLREEIISLDIILYGENDRRVADARWTLADVERIGALDADEKQKLQQAAQNQQQAATKRQEGKNDEAVKLLAEAVRLTAETLGERSHAFSDRLFALGRTQLAVGSLADAATTLERTLEVRKEALGSSQYDVAQVINELGIVREREKNYAAAAQLFRQAEPICEKALGKEHNDTRTLMDNLSRVLEALAQDHQERSDLASCRLVRQELLSLKIKYRGEQHWETVDARLALADVERLAGLTPEQRSLLKEAKAIRAKAAELETQLAFDEALALGQQALEICDQILGPEHLQTADYRIYVGDLYDAVGNQPLAQQNYEQSLKVRETLLSAEHPLTAQNHDLLGRLLASQGDSAAARGHLEQALLVRKKLLGEEHVLTVSTRQQLEAIGAALGNPNAMPLTSIKLGEMYTAVLRHGERAKQLPSEEKRTQELLVNSQMLSIASRAFGPDSETEAVLLETRALLLAQGDDFAAAIRTQTEALQMWKRVRGAKLWAVTDARLWLDHYERLHNMTPDERRRLKEAQQLQDGLPELQKARKYEEAIAQAQRVLLIYREVLGKEHRWAGEALAWLGSLHGSVEQNDDARRYYDQALALRRKTLGEDHPDVALTLNLLGTQSQRAGQFAEARRFLEQDLAICKAAYGDESERVAGGLNTLANLLMVMGDHSSARPYIEQALAMRKKLLGPENADTGNSLISLGMALKGLGDAAAARPLIEQGLAIFKKALGDTHPNTLIALSDLSDVLKDMGDYAGAREKIEEAWSITRKTLGPGDRTTLEYMRQHATISHAMGDQARAIKVLRESLALCEPSQGRASSNYIASADLLAAIHEGLAAECEKRDDFEAARTARKEVLRIKRELHGDAHWEVTDARQALADVDVLAALDPQLRQRLRQTTRPLDYYHELWQAGKSQQARQEAQEALQVAEQVYGKVHRAVCEAIIMTAAVPIAEGRIAEVEPIYRRNCEINLAVLGREHPIYAMSLALLAQACENAKRFDEALALHKECVEVNRKLFGQTSVLYQDAVRSMATLHDRTATQQEEQHAWATAQKTRREALALYASLGAENDWQTLSARQALARVEHLAKLDADQSAHFRKQEELSAQARQLADQEQFTAAIDAATEAVKLRRETFGREHLDTAEGLMTLGDIQRRSGAFAAAKLSYEEALAIFRKQLGSHHPRVAYSLNQLGWVLDDYGDYGTARLRLEEALAIDERLGKDDSELSGILNNLGLTLEKLGDVPKARAHLERSLGIRKRVFGLMNDHTAHALRNLASVLSDAGLDADARVCLEQALQIAIHLHGNESEEAASCQQALSYTLAELGEDKAAVANAQRAVETMRKLYGDKHPKTAIALRELGRRYNDQGDFASAEANLKQALAIFLELVGENHRESVICLNQLGGVHREAGDYATARAYFERALAAIKLVLGPEHHDVAQNLTSLGNLEQELGSYKAARPLYEQALAIDQKNWGADDPRLAKSLMLLGTKLQEMGYYSLAAQRFNQALEIRNKIGRDHADTAQTLSLLGMVYYSQSDYAAARHACEQALEIDRKVFGPKNMETAKSLTYVGMMTQAMGDYQSARPYWEQALAIAQQVYGPEHPGVITYLNNLGVLLGADDPAGRQYYEQALAIARKELEREQPPTAGSLARVGHRLRNMKRYREALPYFEQATAARKELLGPDHPHTVGSLHRVGETLIALGDLKAARPYYEQSLSITKARAGANDRLKGFYLLELGKLLSSLGDYDASRPLLEEALALYSHAYGQEHPVYLEELVAVGSFLRDAGDYDAAQLYLERAIRIRTRALGPDHRLTGETRIHLGQLLAAVGKPREAWSQLTMGAEIHAQWINHMLAANAESEHLAIASRWRIILEGLFNLAETAPNLAKERWTDLAAAILEWKAPSSQTLLARQEALALEGDEASVRLYEQLKSVRARFVEVRIRGPEMGSPDEYAQQLEDLRTQHDALERRLDEQLKDYLKLRQTYQAGPEAVARQLDAGSALVELVKYRQFDFRARRDVDGWGKPRYAAVIIGKQQTSKPDVAFVVLGEAAPIESAIHAWRKAAQAGSISEDIEREIRQRVWQPLAAALPKEITRLYIAPDGEFALLPLEAIRLEDGSYLLQKLQISYVANGRDLIPRLKPRGQPNPPVVVSDPDFDLSPRSPAAADAGQSGVAQSRSRDLGRGALRFESLPGFGGETTAVVNAWQAARPREQIEVLSGGQATEENLALLKRPRVLHLVTHGFLLPDLTWLGSEPDSPDQNPNSQPQPAVSMVGARGLASIVEPSPSPGGKSATMTPAYREDARLRSGIALAGANRWRQRVRHGQSDGLLTALEAQNLNLWGTELVVLSACETGLGEIEVGEGVMGLRRSFQQAGADTVVASLWKVPDHATKALMARFYENLWQKKMGKLEALREAQLWMLEHGAQQPEIRREMQARGLKELESDTQVTKSHLLPPYYWAAWVLSGDWR